MFTILPFLSMVMIRNVYLYLALKQEKMEKILRKTNRRHFAEAAMILSAVLPLIEINITKFFPVTLKIINILMTVSIFLSYIIAVKIAIRSFKSQDFIDSIYSMSIIILGFRLFAFTIFDRSFMTYIPGKAVFFFFAYNILLIGIFVEITYILL